MSGPHNHAQTRSTNQGTTVALGGVTGGGSMRGTVENSMAGESRPISNVPPELAMRYCIAIEGLFPPRS